MRKTQASMSESIFTTDDPTIVQTTIQTFDDGKRRRRFCLSAIWLMSNILTFTVGYYVKTMYFKDDCLTNDGGSM